LRHSRRCRPDQVSGAGDEFEHQAAGSSEDCSQARPGESDCITSTYKCQLT
jgi:hypothetical protein